MSFALRKGLSSVSNGVFTGAAGTAIDTSLRNLADTLNNRALDVKIQYGAVGDGSTNDTTAIQAAIDAAHAAVGIAVYLPPGTYSCGALTWYSDVPIIGPGPALATIKARSGTTSMLSYQNTVETGGDAVHPLGLLSGFTLDGNSVASVVGIDVRGVYGFDFRDLEIHHCATGIKGRGLLCGNIYAPSIHNCTVGIDLDSTTLSSNPWPSNLVHVWGGRVMNCSSYGIQSANSSMLCLHGINVELCGTTGDATTGGVKVTGQPGTSNNGIGLLLDNGCWFERNWGHSHVRVITPTSIGWGLICRDTYIANAPPTGANPTYGIHMDGATVATRALLDGVSIPSGTPVGYTTNAIYLSTGATGYADPITAAQSVGGSGTMTTWGTAGASDYYTSVVADAPIYFNRLNGSASPLAPVIGTGSFTLNNGALANQTGAMSADTTDASVGFDGTNDSATASIDLSSHSKIAVEMWLKVTTTGSNPAIFDFGHWGTNAGTFAAFYDNTHAAAPFIYASTYGNVGYNEVRIECGDIHGAFVHLVIVFDRTQTTNEITKAFVNGVSQTMNYAGSTTSNNTDAFRSDSMILAQNFAADSPMAGNIQDLAIYGTTIPSDSVWAAHYAARTVAR